MTFCRYNLEQKWCGTHAENAICWLIHEIGIVNERRAFSRMGKSQWRELELNCATSPIIPLETGSFAIAICFSREGRASELSPLFYTCTQSIVFAQLHCSGRICIKKTWVNFFDFARLLTWANLEIATLEVEKIATSQFFYSTLW